MNACFRCYFPLSPVQSAPPTVFRARPYQPQEKDLYLVFEYVDTDLSKVRGRAAAPAQCYLPRTTCSTCSTRSWTRCTTYTCPT